MVAPGLSERMKARRAQRDARKQAQMVFTQNVEIKDIPYTPVQTYFREGVPDREALSQLAYGISIELGVAAGAYSETLLQNPKVDRLYSVDRWGNDGKHTDAEYLSVLHRFKKYGRRSIIIRRSFELAFHFFNQIFDFIYVDGYAHTGQDGGKTLEQWWSKLKRGGVFAGHDYHPKWQPTINVVNQFVAQRGLRLYVTKEVDLQTHVYPSWYVFKP